MTSIVQQRGLQVYSRKLPFPTSVVRESSECNVTRYGLLGYMTLGQCPFGCLKGWGDRSTNAETGNYGIALLTDAMKLISYPMDLSMSRTVEYVFFCALAEACCTVIPSAHFLGLAAFQI